MKHYLIDTNCTLRYLLNDIPKQSKIVREYFILAKERQITITVPLLVFVELEFALTRFYHFSRKQIGEKLIAISQMPYLDIENREILIRALIQYRSSTVSFVDLLFYFFATLNNRELLTFDKKLKKL